MKTTIENKGIVIDLSIYKVDLEEKDNKLYIKLIKKEQ